MVVSTSLGNGIEYGDLPMFVNFEDPAAVTVECRGPEGLAMGCEVLCRDTTAPLWEKVIPAGSQFEITTHYSKDNVVFTVRANDADGHRSLLVYPTPER